MHCVTLAVINCYILIIGYNNCCTVLLSYSRHSMTTSNHTDDSKLTVSDGLRRIVTILINAPYKYSNLLT